MAEEKIVIGIEVRGGADKKLKKTGQEGKKAGKQIQIAFKAAGRAFDNFTANIASAATLGAFNAARNAAVGLFDTFVVQGVAAAQVQENAINELNSALARSGEFSVEASKDMENFADSVELTTKFSGDAILQQLALAKAFGATNEQAKRVTEAALELSVAAGISLEEATRRVGRTFSGSVADVSKFAIGITKLTKEELAAGKAADELIKSLGGTAAAQLNTFSGTTAQLGNTFGSLQEAVGNTIIKNVGFVTAIKEVNTILSKAVGFVENNSKAISRFALNLLDTAISIIPSFIKGINFISDAFTSLDISALKITKAFANIKFILGSITAKELLEIEKGIRITTDELVAGAIKQEEFFNRLASTAEETRERIREAGVGELDDQAEKFQMISEQVEEQRSIELDSQSEFNEKAQKEIETTLEREIKTRNDRIKSLQTIDAKANSAEIKSLKAQNKAIISGTTLRTNKVLAIEAAAVAEKQKQRETDLRNTASVFGNLSSLTASNNKTLFAIGKASAVAQSLIAASLAITKAFAAGPFLGPILAASIAVKTGIEISRITATKLQGGIDSVPGIGTADQFPALLAPGERVVPRETNIDLKEFLSSQRDNREILSDISAKLGALENRTTVNIGNNVIVDELRNALDDGRLIEV